MLSPHDRRLRVGTVRTADAAAIEAALAARRRGGAGLGPRWADRRARAILDKAADLYERDRVRLMAVMVREAGKTLDNALGDVREAVDFLRYYAAEARRLFAGPSRCRARRARPTRWRCGGAARSPAISPWNFPLAIFTGQVAAALAAGNPVLAKPAEQTPIVAWLAVQAAARGGRAAATCCICCPAPARSAPPSSRIRAWRASPSPAPTTTGWAINQALAARRGAIVPFIAETGGMNAMIANSSALPEQVIRDVVRSAFDSAGQRCSAARLFFVQEDVAGA